jgi:VWFA-related protein
MRFCFLISVTLLLQSSPAQQADNASFKISVNTNLVVVNVDVRDKSGKPVEGLKASDFTLLEDDKPQPISVFDYQRLDWGGSGPSAASGSVEPPAAIVSTAPSAPAPSSATATSAGALRYRDRRLLILYFDLSSMPAADQVRAQTAALKFIDQQLSPADLVSVLTFSTQLKVIQEFTADREALRAAVGSLRVGEGTDLVDLGSTGDDTTGVDNGEAYTADETEFNVFNTDRKLSALEDAVRRFTNLPEKKALIYFSSGVSKNGLENQSQLRSTTNAAVRANVAIYTVDARGLVAAAPLGNADTGSQRGSGAYTGAANASMRASFADQQETLVTLAGDTGGKALLDTNDLTMGIQQAQRDIASYYVLGYYSNNLAKDGKFRHIKVRLNPSVRATVNYRQGYFAAKEFRNFSESDKERQLEDALLLGDPVTELPMAVEVNYFRMARRSYFVPVAIKLPGSALELVRKRGGSSAEFDFIGQVRDASGKLAASVRDGITVKLSEDAAGRLANRNLQYDAGFTLPPGAYTVKLLARENVTGRLGTFEAKFRVPDLSTETAWLHTSSVVWSNQREPLAAAVGSASKDKKLMAAHPLIEEGQKLVPSVTRVYRNDQRLYVYAEVYDTGASPDVIASLALYRQGLKQFETEPLHVRELAAGRDGALPVRIEMPLASLRPGTYECQLNLIDPTGGKFAFSRAPLVLVR